MAVSPDHRSLVAARRRERTRAHLLETAVYMVVERGGEAIPIDELLARAEVARGTFYKYFPDAASLVQAMSTAITEELITHLDALVKTRADPAERLAIGMLGVLQLAERLPPLGALLARSGWPHASLGPSHALHRLVAPDLARGLASGRFVAIDLRIALDLTAGLALAGAHRIASEVVADDYAAQLTATWLRALGLGAAEASRLAALAPELPALPPDSLLARLAPDMHAR